jgi:hypothetical protein
MIPGKLINLGGKDYTLPPLNFAGLRKLGPKIQEVGGAYLSGNLFMDVDKVGVVAEIVLAALQRNYPDLTLEEVENFLDFANVKEVFPALMGVSGLEFKEGHPEGEPAPGEAPASPK